LSSWSTHLPTACSCTGPLVLPLLWTLFITCNHGVLPPSTRRNSLRLPTKYSQLLRWSKTIHLSCLQFRLVTPAHCLPHHRPLRWGYLLLSHLWLIWPTWPLSFGVSWMWSFPLQHHPLHPRRPQLHRSCYLP
jgi:hypothetical protein